ncbi:uncharacterized protein BDZ99DRAFT_467023 [Mytilinidion resinicola]|uniref:NAD(P)-binding domain-containing protein n=1 Tax=Mytilinidion resinicola TaxID=574789 RepID=A0A6A6YAB5_9PEZI|nr:uncharacterized protein BDZ99DRAFT_467023 [Mytilinidion resinicola]KAF2804767.1 hypothetical protein BDZ99DRAFT_467023 [Mytilinidion resinicola]
MKILITGATGKIGRQSLLQFLQHPSITSVVSLSRRHIPSESLPNSEKFKNVIVKDFSNWSQEIMEIIKDADAMFWAMGTNDASSGPNFDWPVAFQAAMLKAREAQSRTTRFRFIFCSGKFVVQNQDAWLFFLPGARKLKGRTEVVCLEFAIEHKDVWQTFVVKPGGFITPDMFGRRLLPMLMGDLVIDCDEFSAYIAELIATGKEEEGLIYNKRMVGKGRELLQTKTDRT